MSAVGKTPIGVKFIRISSHTPKNIQEGIAAIICEDINILSHPTHHVFSSGNQDYIEYSLK